MRTDGHGGTRLRWLLAGRCDCVLAARAEARDATVRSFDQTPISMHFFPAAGLAAGKSAPTVLVGPGWSQAGETDENSSSLGAVRRTSASARCATPASTC